MTRLKPKAFTQRIKGGTLDAGYLFLGPELFFRDRCRKALRNAVVGDDGDGFVEVDLREQPLGRLLEETRSLSLFATSRLVWGSNAESALPRGRSKAGEAVRDEFARYFADPTPGVVVALECTKLDSNERDDKAKLERLVKFFQATPVIVEMDRLGPQDALRAAVAFAKQKNVDIDRDALAGLVEMLGADTARLENEIEKLALFCGDGRRITREEIETLVPEARQGNVFALSGALARKDCQGALEILDVLAQSGAYWPMQVTLLAGLFRQALAAKEAGGRSPQQVTAQLAAAGVRIWQSRARQLLEITQQFSRQELESALIALFEADRDLRREKPSERLIMERLVLQMTA